ncbi:hypothetical protein PR048_027237 [Dryococelus australis]|uniref:Uncharacterized protein n=1 Tax=Dryococelus australis TaxID=614101 RepID=A0ABQ9GEW3_9NEOP|nr:hypothetical protein PR048_027237 [Dryococelus australis]
MAKCLGTLPTYAPGQLDVLGHDGDSFGVDSTQVGVLKQPHQVGFTRLLQSHNCRALEAQVGLEVLRNLSYQALEGQLADEQFGAFLVAPNLPQSWGTLASSFCSELLSWGFTSRRLTGCLVRAILVSWSVRHLLCGLSAATATTISNHCRSSERGCARALEHFASSFQDKIDAKHVYTEVDFAIRSQFIRHALDDSKPIADFQGNSRPPVVLSSGEPPVCGAGVLGSNPRAQENFTEYSFGVTRFERLLTAASSEPKRVIEVSVERRLNERVGEAGDPGENPVYQRLHSSRFPLKLRGNSVPINYHFTIVRPNHVEFSQKRSDFTCIWQPMEKRRWFVESVGFTVNILYVFVAGSYVSGITLLGMPSEMYMYGTQYWVVIFPEAFVSITMALVYLPVFYKLQITSSYEVSWRLYARCTGRSYLQTRPAPSTLAFSPARSSEISREDFETRRCNLENETHGYFIFFQYLKLRFNQTVRLMGSVLFLLKMPQAEVSAESILASSRTLELRAAAVWSSGATSDMFTGCEPARQEVGTNQEVS